MKIIENNYKPEYPKTIICFCCKSLLSYSKEDEIIEIFEEYDQINRESYKINCKMLVCPCCNHKFKI